MTRPTAASSVNPYIVVRRSSIHHKGVFAKKDIAKGTRIIEYIGEKITKKESHRRADEFIEKSIKDKTHGAVYIFELNKRWDIDGNVPYNTARYINHSCDPNCEVEDDRGHIWICAIQDIKKGDELTYNYGYDYEHYQDHPCECGTGACVGYIVAKKHWWRVRRNTLKLQSKSKNKK